MAARPMVLVIDDEVIILLGMRVMLEGWGYDVLAATSEEEALRLLDADGRRPGAVMADYRLRNGKTGSQALRAVHGRLGEALPSIIITGDTAPERIVEAQQSGFAIMHKPVAAPELRRWLDQACGRG